MMNFSGRQWTTIQTRNRGYMDLIGINHLVLNLLVCASSVAKMGAKWTIHTGGDQLAGMVKSDLTFPWCTR